MRKKKAVKKKQVVQVRVGCCRLVAIRSSRSTRWRIMLQGAAGNTVTNDILDKALERHFPIPLWQWRELAKLISLMDKNTPLV